MFGPGSLGYHTSNSGNEYGWIQMDNGEGDFSTELCIKQGEELRVEVDPINMKVTWRNTKTTRVIELSSSFKNQKLFLYVKTNKTGQSVEIM